MRQNLKLKEKRCSGGGLMEEMHSKFTFKLKKIIEELMFNGDE